MFTYEGKKMYCGPCRAQLAKSVLILASVQGTFGFTKNGPFGALLAKYVLILGKRAAPLKIRKETLWQLLTPLMISSLWR